MMETSRKEGRCLLPYPPQCVYGLTDYATCCWLTACETHLPFSASLDADDMSSPQVNPEWNGVGSPVEGRQHLLPLQVSVISRKTAFTRRLQQSAVGQVTPDSRTGPSCIGNLGYTDPYLSPTRPKADAHCCPGEPSELPSQSRCS